MIALWFLHAWLALAAAPIGAGAIAVHLLNRTRSKPKRWAAMQFLQAAILRSRRRLTLERWLLIALRTAMLVLLALFVARPIVRGVSLAAGPDTCRALLIVVDNSLTLQAPASDPRKNLQTAATDAILPMLHKWHGPVAILPAVAGPKPRWFDQPDRAEAVLNSIPATAGRADWPSLLPRMKSVLDDSHVPSHRCTVLIVTSLTRGNWPRTDLLRQQLTDLKRAAGLFLLLDLQPSTRSNATITDLAAESALAGRDLPIRATATIVDRSAQSPTHLKLIWNIDGRQTRTDTLSVVPANTPQTITADLPPLAPGYHNISASLASGAPGTANQVREDGSETAVATQHSALSTQYSLSDALAADNQRWASITIPASRRIVVVEPALSAPPADRASLFVAAALSAAAAQSAVPLRIDTTAPSGLQSALVEPADAILLCDAGPLSDSDLSLLKEQLDRGTGLISWLGPRTVDLAAQDSGLSTQRPALSTVFAAIPAAADTAPSRADWRVRLVDSPPAALVDLAESQASQAANLGSIHTLAKVSLSPDTQILAQTTTGLPVVLLRQAGSGRSILVTTSPDLSWSTLASEPTFPAFVLALVREVMHEPADGTQVTAGQPIRLTLPAGAAMESSRWIKPDGSAQPARISLDGGVARAELPLAAQPGAYQLEAGNATQTAFANADSQAGDLRDLNAASRSDLSEAGVTIVAPTDLSTSLAIVVADEWSRPLAYVLLILVLLEMTLTAVFTRARTI